MWASLLLESVPVTKGQTKEITADVHRGCDLWQNHLNLCVIAGTNHRAKLDPEWAFDLTKFRDDPNKSLLKKFKSTTSFEQNLTPGHLGSL